MKINKVISPISSLFSQSSLINWTGRKMIFPFYHAVSNERLPYISNLYPLRSIEEFNADLDFLCQHFNPINLEEVIQRVQAKNKNEKPAFHLTFDDGLKEIHETIAPILEERNIPATFFVNSDFIDNERLFYRYKVGMLIDYLNENKADAKRQKIKAFLIEKTKWKKDIHNSLMHLNYHDQNLINEMGSMIGFDFDLWLSQNKPYASSTQLKDLIDRGFTIGSHSKDHPRFKHIELRTQKRQIAESFEYLKKNFNIEKNIFSFPFGDEAVSKALFDWMYGEEECSLSFGVSGIKDDYCPSHLHRIPMDKCAGDPGRFIKSEYLYFLLKGIFNRNQIKRT